MDLSALFTVKGRYGRKSFWLSWLGLVAVSLVAAWTPAMGAVVAPVPGAKAALGFAAFAATFVIFYCQVCIIAKRLHDMGRSGWIQAAPMIGGFVVGLAGATAAQLAGDPTIAAWAGALTVLIGGGFLAWIGLTPSQPSANRWGSPAGRAAAAEAFA